MTFEKKDEYIKSLEERIERQTELIKRYQAFVQYVGERKKSIYLGAIGEQLLNNIYKD
jgi:hypothetical protein